MTTPDPKVNAQVEGLATLLVLDDEIKKIANLREFGFFTTNETHRLIPYHTAYLWRSQKFNQISLLAQSGTAELDQHALANQWLKELISKLIDEPHAKELHQIDLNEIKDKIFLTDSEVA